MTRNMKISKILAVAVLLTCGAFAQYQSLQYGTTTVPGVVNLSGIPTYLYQSSNLFLAYTVSGSPSSFSIQIEGSVDNGATYTLCGSPSTVLPMTRISCTGTLYDHARINITAMSGGTSPSVLWSFGGITEQQVDIVSLPAVTLSGSPSVSISGTPSVTVSGTVPVTFSSATDPCNDPNQDKSSVPVSVGASSTLELIPLTSGQRIYPCYVMVTAGAAGTFQLVAGSGTNCATTQTTITGAFTTLTGTPLSSGASLTLLSIPVSKALCGITTGLLSTANDEGLMSSLNSNPIIITADADIATGWRASQTLNVGVLPGYTFKRQRGLWITKVMVMGASNTALPAITVSDPVDSTVLYVTPALAAITGASSTWSENFDETPLMWRDFKTTGVAGVSMYIWYR
jgi:hypothetical protein